MSTSLLLRIASVISVLFAAGHTLGGRKAWSPQGENQVLQAMRTVRFETFGVSRTYLDFYRGFGFTISVFLAVQAVVLWQLATIASTMLYRSGASWRRWRSLRWGAGFSPGSSSFQCPPPFRHRSRYASYSQSL